MPERRVLIPLETVKYYMELQTRMREFSQARGEVLARLLTDMGLDPNTQYTHHAILAEARDRAMSKPEYRRGQRRRN